MMRQTKVCAVPYRLLAGGLDVLAFRHPLAGNQFVKGTLEAEASEEGARRELREESGIVVDAMPVYLGSRDIGDPPIPWLFYAVETSGLPDAWDHWTDDGGGHLFSFFWHSLSVDLNSGWHPMFHLAFETIRASLPRVIGR